MPNDEIFGPILPIFPYSDIDEAIEYVNARPRPLALYYFGGKGAERRRVLDRTTSGNVSVNGTIMHVGHDDLPFGGVGESGMGQYHGIEGFRILSHPKGHLHPGPLEQHLHAAGALRQARGPAAQLLPPMSAVPDHHPRHRNGSRAHDDQFHSNRDAGSCACGANTFEVQAGVGIQRFYCHCLYCQQFMGEPYTDVSFVRAKNVVIHAEHATFDNPKLLPPGFAHGRGSRFGNRDKGRFAKCASLDRGRCDDCGQPFIETIGGTAGMVFIPSVNFEDQDALPPVQRHIYYRLREQDVTDDLPKHHYFASSQFAIARMIGRVLRRG